MLPLVPLALIAATAAVAAFAAKKKQPDAASYPPPLAPPPGLPIQPPLGIPPQIGPAAEDIWDAALPENYKVYVKEQLAKQTNTTDLETLAAYFYTFGLVKTAMLLLKKANSIHATKGEPLAVWPPRSPLTPGDSPVALPPLGNGGSPVQPPVAQPPVAQPPVAQPPVAQPPVAQPPIAQPVGQPPAPVDWAQAGLAAARAAAAMAQGAAKPPAPAGVPQEWWDRAIVAAQGALAAVPPGSIPGVPTGPGTTPAAPPAPVGPVAPPADMPVGGWILADGRLAYVLQNGDWGEKIAKKFGKGGGDVAALVALNPGFPWNKGVPGMELLLPPTWWNGARNPTIRPLPKAPAGSTNLIPKSGV